MLIYLCVDHRKPGFWHWEDADHFFLFTYVGEAEGMVRLIEVSVPVFKGKGGRVKLLSY